MTTECLALQTWNYGWRDKILYGNNWPTRRQGGRWNAPLNTTREQARPPTFAVSVEEVQPDIEAAEVAAVHVTLWVTSPYFEAEVVDLEIGFPTTMNRLSEALKDSCSVMPDYVTDFICTTPQFGKRLRQLCVHTFVGP